jgi:hypothetical protein
LHNRASRSRETDALEQQTATAEILRIISRSHTDIQPVFDAIADNAVKLFRPWSAAVYRFDGEFVLLRPCGVDCQVQSSICGSKPDAAPRAM